MQARVCVVLTNSHPPSPKKIKFLPNWTWVLLPAAQESQFTITSCEGRHSKYLQGTKQGVLAVHAQKTQTLSPAQFQNYDCHIDIKMNMLKILFLISGRFYNHLLKGQDQRIDTFIDQIYWNKWRQNHLLSQGVQKSIELRERICVSTDHHFALLPLIYNLHSCKIAPTELESGNAER